MNIGFNDKEGNDVDAGAIMIIIIITNVIYMGIQIWWN
jgi:hypothetical protein